MELFCILFVLVATRIYVGVKVIYSPKGEFYSL